MKAHEAFDLYNRVHGEYGLAPLPGSRMRTLRKRFAAFAEWCDAEGIDPERWLRAKLDSTGGRFRIRISALTRASAEFMAHFRDWGAGVQAERQAQDRLQTQAVEDTPRDGSELVVLFEQLKRALEPGLCMGTPEAGGYTAASDICAVCPKAQPCAVFWGRAFVRR